MVLKRKLPSKLTQPNPTAHKDVPSTTDTASTAPAAPQTDFSAPLPASAPQAPQSFAVTTEADPVVPQPAAEAPQPTSFMMDVPEEDLMPSSPASAPAAGFPEMTNPTDGADPFAPSAEAPVTPPVTEEPAAPEVAPAAPESPAQPDPAPAMAVPTSFEESEAPSEETASETTREEAFPAVQSQTPPPPSFATPPAPKSSALQRKRKTGNTPFGEEKPQQIAKQQDDSNLLGAVKEETEEEELLPTMVEKSHTAAPTHFDGSDRVETSLKEIRGEFVDPSHHETEAAYISAPAENGYDSPRMKLPDLPLPGTENQTLPPLPSQALPAQEEPAGLAADLQSLEAELGASTPVLAKETEVKPAKETEPKPDGAPKEAAPAAAAPPSPFAAPEKPDLGWNLEGFAPTEKPQEEAKPEAATPPAPTNPFGQDFFADVNLEKPVPLAPLPKEDGAMEPPKFVPIAGSGDGRKPPELPKSPESAISSPRRSNVAGSFKIIVGAAVVLLAGVSYLVFSSGGDEGKLNKAYVSLNQSPSAEKDLLPPPALTQEKNLKPVNKIPADTDIEDFQENQGEGSQIAIDFVNEENAAGENVITAKGDEEMPEELGALAKFQQAVMRERAKQEGKEDLSELENAMEEAQTPEGDDITAYIPSKEDVSEELAEYRKALAEANAPEDLPKPNEFLNNYHKNSGRPVTQQELAEMTGTTQDDMLAPPVLENPYNLPVIPQPESQASEPGVRTLEDFDMAAFEPEEKRVRIPKGVRPRLSAAQFPAVEVLSFVPDRGIIATNRGREGVLLIGESIEGWELVTVAQDYAEFNNGTRKYTLVRRN